MFCTPYSNLLCYELTIPNVNWINMANQVHLLLSSNMKVHVHGWQYLSIDFIMQTAEIYAQDFGKSNNTASLY